MTEPNPLMNDIDLNYLINSEIPLPEDEQEFLRDIADFETPIPDLRELREILPRDDLEFGIEPDDPTVKSFGELDHALTVTKGKFARERKATRELRKRLRQVETELRFYRGRDKKEGDEREQRDVLYRTLPNAHSIEQLVLGMYFKDPNLMEQSSQPYLHLQWYNIAHKTIHGAMIDLGNRTDPSTVFEKLKDQGLNEAVGGMAYITKLVQAGESGRPDNLPKYLQTLEDKHLAREIIHTCTTALRDCYDGMVEGEKRKCDPIESYPEYIRRLSINVLQILPWRFLKKLDLRAAVDETMEEFEDLVRRKGKPRISTGYKGLDRIMHGILPHRLTIVGARTKIGKTTFALNLMNNVAMQGHSSAIFSFESSSSELIQKLTSMYSRVDSERFVYWEEDSMPPEEIQRIKDAAAHLKQMPIHIDDSKPNLDYIVGRTKQLKSQHPDLALVIVDGLQGFEGYVPYQGNKSDIYAEIIKRLKYLAVELDVNVVLNSQLKQDVEKRKNKRPRWLEDFPDCKHIPEIADAAVMLYRPEFYWPDSEAYAGWIEVIPAAMRVGDKNKKGFKLSIDMKTSQISEYGGSS
jgi:replicative DNA helicase